MTNTQRSTSASRPASRTGLPAALAAVLATAALVFAPSLAAQDADDARTDLRERGLRGEYPATFSILGFDPETGEIGAAVASRVFSVGNGVIWGEANVGVVATQAIVDVSYGPKGIELLEQGLSPAEVEQALLEQDPNPDPENWPEAGRQFAIMDAEGNVVAHTGPQATDWAGHRVEEYVSAQGNILAGPGVVDAMVEAFQSTEGHLSLRLMAAMEAGEAAGGDRRGKQSAAMLVVGEDRGVWLNNDVVVRLQVDDAEEPLVELRRLVEIAARQRERRNR